MKRAINIKWKNPMNANLEKVCCEYVQDNGFLHFRHFLGPDHLVQFSAWLPFAPYLSSLEILLGFSEFNLPTLFTRLESGTTDVQSFPTWKCLMLGLTLHVFFPSRLWMYCKLKSFKVRHKVQLFWKGHKNLKKSPYWVKTTVLSKQVGDYFKFFCLLIMSEL